MFLVRMVLVFLTLATPVVAQNATGRIQVTGQGSVAMAPDMATINVAAVNEARTASEALTQNSAVTAGLLEKVASDGIEARDVQTSGLSLSPVWNNRNTSNARPTIVGFMARNQITIRVRDLDVLGGVLDTLVSNGASEFNGLNFGVQEPQGAIDVARQNAVKDALRKATLLTDAAGVSLGKVIEINENGGSSSGPYLAREMAMASDVPIAGGEVDLQSSVTMIFEVLE